MSPITYESWLERLDPVSLTEINNVAEFQTRIDRKYLLKVNDVLEILRRTEVKFQALEIGGKRQFKYRSTYLDTEDMSLHKAAACKRESRHKLRVREYLDSQICFLEIKSQSRREESVKSRVEISLQVDERNLKTDLRRLMEVSKTKNFEQFDSGMLKETVITLCTRTTLLAPNDSSRVTIDMDCSLSTCEEDVSIFEGWVIVEIKGGPKASPFDRELWHSGHRPVPISKYALGVALFFPEQPTNIWTTTLRKLEIIKS